MSAGVAGPRPQCAATIPASGPYPAWCDTCGRNLAGPPEEPSRQSKLDVVDRRLASRLGAGLAAEFSADTDLRPRFTRAKAAAYALAVLTLALALFFGLLGVVLLVLGVTRPNIAFVVLGALFLSVGVLMRPRLGRAPQGVPLSRDDAPALHRLVDDVSAALGTRADEGGAGRRPVERVLVGHRGAIDRELAPLHVRRRASYCRRLSRSVVRPLTRRPRRGSLELEAGEVHLDRPEERCPGDREVLDRESRRVEERHVVAVRAPFGGSGEHRTQLGHVVARQ